MAGLPRPLGARPEERILPAAAYLVGTAVALTPKISRALQRKIDIDRPPLLCIFAIGGAVHGKRTRRFSYRKHPRLADRHLLHAFDLGFEGVVGSDQTGVVGVPAALDNRVRRRMDKEWAPGCWEVPGGGVRAGESAENAVKREILEETGVDVSNADGGYVFSYKRVNPEEKNNYFVDIFRYTMDIPDSAVHTQEREVMEYAFATLEQIQEYGKQGVFLHYDSIKQVFTD